MGHALLREHDTEGAELKFGRQAHAAAWPSHFFQGCTVSPAELELSVLISSVLLLLAIGTLWSVSKHSMIECGEV